MPRLILPSLLLLCGLGCEQTTRLSVEIVLSPEVMADVAEYPARVGFNTDMHSGRTFAVCEPSETELRILLEDVSSSCVLEPLVVNAWMGSYLPPSTGCVEESAGAVSSLAEGPHDATGTALAFTEASSATCISREEVIEVVLESGGV